MSRSQLGRFALAAVLATCVAAATALAAPWGVPIGGGSVRAEIAPAGDSDAYMLEARRGMRLDVRVKVPRGSDLSPVTRLVGPDGLVDDAAFEPAGRGLRLRRFDVPATGRYAVEVAGEDDSTGEYRISARLRGGLSTRFQGLTIGAAEEHAIEFAAGGGAKIGFTVKGRDGAPSFVRIESPLGAVAVVPDDAVKRDAGRLRAKKIVLPAEQPFGPWRLIVRANTGTLRDLKVSVSVRGGRLQTGRGRLPSPEPALVGVAPVEAGEDTIVELTGSGLLSTARRPLRVFFGGAEATGVEVSGAMVTARFPAGLDGPVDASLLNGDGHAASLAGAVLAVPPPRPTSVVPARGPGGGGATVDVFGTGFRLGAAVTVAGSAFPNNTEFVSAEHLRFETPPFAGGQQSLGVRDPTGQEGLVAGGFTFVPAPLLLAVEPPLLPRLPDETVSLDGGNFDSSQDVFVGATPADAVEVVSSTRLDVTLPELALGAHDVSVIDDLQQEARRTAAVTVFTFAAGPETSGTGGPPPSDVAVADYDDDGDLDVFLVSAGSDSISSTSLLRVLRNDGDEFTDVSLSVLPTVGSDDWRGNTIAIGDIAGDVSTPPPDGRPDIVIGFLDEDVLPDGRSRVRILANRTGPGGSRLFVDRTDVLMAAPFEHDDWRASDLWIGDLDGDGGLEDILATHDEMPTGESPLTPYYAYYLSGTRMFSFATAGSYGRFAWQSRRFPTIIGTRVPKQGFPLCSGGACADNYMPFRGTSLSVVDLDADGRRDVVVTSPRVVSVNGSTVSSTQFIRNVVDPVTGVMSDATSSLNPASDPMVGDIVLTGDVSGTAEPDIISISSTVSGSGLSIAIAENRGFGLTWPVRTSTLLPSADDDERLQADAAALTDVDGDGDADLVLLTSAAPTQGATTTGRGLRLLRNRGGEGFSRELEVLLPAADGAEDWSGAALAIGDLAGDGGLGIVLARSNALGDGAEIRTIRRVTEE